MNIVKKIVFGLSFIMYLIVLAINVFFTISAFYFGLFYKCIGMFDNSCERKVTTDTLVYILYIDTKQYAAFILFGVVLIIASLIIALMIYFFKFKKRKLFIIIIICLALLFNPMTFLLFRTINNDYYSSIECHSPGW